MFGFGRPINETVIIRAFEEIVLPLAGSRDAANDVATKIVDDVLRELRAAGVDPFKSTTGDERVKLNHFTSPRLAAGLTIEDIKFYWNRPLVTIFSELKVREYFSFMELHMASQQGKDLVAFGSDFFKKNVRYGDPSKWNPKDHPHLSESDADIYPEFLKRIEAWRDLIGDEKIDNFVNSHGTFNAAIRAQLTAGTI